MYRKQKIKNIVMISIILFIAVFSTYYIYYSFNDTTNIDYSSNSLDITFHEELGEKLDITKVTPVTDSVGLSSKGHTFTITNNLTEPVEYKILIVDNEDNLPECKAINIPKEQIRISVKAQGGETEVYSLSELENNVLLSVQAKALEEKKYTVRIWINTEASLPSGTSHHYHGLIQVIENDMSVAIK